MNEKMAVGGEDGDGRGAVVWWVEVGEWSRILWRGWGWKPKNHSNSKYPPN